MKLLNCCHLNLPSINLQFDQAKTTKFIKKNQPHQIKLAATNHETRLNFVIIATIINILIIISSSSWSWSWRWLVLAMLPNVVAEYKALLHLFVALGLCRTLQRKYSSICIFERIWIFVYLKTFFLLIYDLTCLVI